jgi:hypothetical protein
MTAGRWQLDQRPTDWGVPMATEHSDNARVEHHDDRFEERRNRYGETAEMTVEDLQLRAADEGIEGRSSMNKDQLIEALGGRRS